MIKRKCVYPNCNEFAVEGHTYCEKHLEQSHKKHEAFLNARRTNSNFYNSERWRKLRREVIRETPYCVCCGSTSNLTVDHIVAPRGNEELFYDKTNLQVLCKDCHDLKTVQEIQARKNHD